MRLKMGGGTGIPCPDPANPCWEACALDGQDCAMWEAVYWPEPERDALQVGPENVAPRACGDCAYRPGSPERRENDGDLPLGFDPEKPFYCHTGMSALVGYTHAELGVSMLVSALPSMQDGFLIGSLDYSVVQDPDRRRGWMADGRPLVVCGGWWAHARKARAVAS